MVTIDLLFRVEISHRPANFKAEFTLANMLHSNFKSVLSFQVTTTNSEMSDSKTFQFLEILILRRKYFSKIRVKKISQTIMKTKPNV